MITRKMNRYWCEYCHKAGSNKYAMGIHEAHCTKNPNRNCRMCDLGDAAPIQIKQAMELLPNPEMYKKESDWGFVQYPGLEKKIEEVFPEIREILSNCPACIMSSLRQKGIHISYAEFDYKEEVKEWWEHHNNREDNEY